MPASDPFTQEAIDKMIADADPDWDDTKRETRMSGYVRALAAEVNRLRASRPEWQKCRQEQIEAIRERDQARADLAAAKATIATLTTEEQKWRDSFFTAIAKRDTMRLALSSIENDICDEPFQGLEAPCGCCRSHIKTARRALDE